MIVEIKKQELIDTYKNQGVKATMAKYKFNNTGTMYRYLKRAGVEPKQYTPRKKYKLV
jgi:hypothetical protein